mgnify:CR=1 FL=1|jgi:hypothetical protein
MSSNKLKELAAYKAKIVALEKEIAAEQTKKLANLHKEVGLESTADLIAALKGLTKAPRKVTKRRAKRTRITDSLKAEVGKAVKAGKKGAEIARQFGISIPSIQNIKNELGLVKKRGQKKAVKKATKKVAKKAARKKAGRKKTQK